MTDCQWCVCNNCRDVIIFLFKILIKIKKSLLMKKKSLCLFNFLIRSKLEFQMSIKQNCAYEFSIFLAVRPTYEELNNTFSSFSYKNWIFYKFLTS